MSNLALTRIDSRLIHGQLAIQWCHATQASVVLVANDDASSNLSHQAIMNMALPSGVKALYWSIEETIQQWDMLHSERILLVCKCVQDVVKLKKNGIEIEKVNVGNMPLNQGKWRISEHVAVDDEDKSAFTALKNMGVEIEIRSVPDFAAEDTSKLFE